MFCRKWMLERYMEPNLLDLFSRFEEGMVTSENNDFNVDDAMNREK
jgi:hypothetical protein